MSEASALVPPAISVVMPVYNGGPYLAEAIQCILGQTYAHFEFIIIDDGSTDGSRAVIQGFHDPRIRLFSQPNQGLAAALNNGIAQARGEWIARQDADDVSHPERFAKEMAFLAANPEVGLLGTWAIITNSAGNPIGVHEHPTEDERIRYALLFDSPFVHSSVMVRRSLFDAVGGYNGDPMLFEDFDMWARMIAHTRGANIPEHLVRYREVSTSFSRLVTNWSDRLVAQRQRVLGNVFPTSANDLLISISEHGLRHARIPIEHFLPVRALLAGYIHRTIHIPAVAREVRTRMRHTMLGYRLIPHRTFLHRVADRALKELLLLWSDLQLALR